MIVAEEYRSKTSLNDRGKKISVENYNKREKFFYYFLSSSSLVVVTKYTFVP